MAVDANEPAEGWIVDHLGKNGWHQERLGVTGKEARCCQQYPEAVFM